MRNGQIEKSKENIASAVHHDRKHWFVFRGEEGIELQVLSNKPSSSNSEPLFGHIPINYVEDPVTLPSTDADSLDSGEYEEIAEKPNSTIGKASF